MLKTSILTKIFVYHLYKK